MTMHYSQIYHTGDNKEASYRHLELQAHPIDIIIFYHSEETFPISRPDSIIRVTHCDVTRRCLVPT